MNRNIHRSSPTRAFGWIPLSLVSCHRSTVCNKSPKNTIFIISNAEDNIQWWMQMTFLAAVCIKTTWRDKSSPPNRYTSCSSYVSFQSSKVFAVIIYRTCVIKTLPAVTSSDHRCRQISKFKVLLRAGFNVFRINQSTEHLGDPNSKSKIKILNCLHVAVPGIWLTAEGFRVLQGFLRATLGAAPPRCMLHDIDDTLYDHTKGTVNRYWRPQC